MNFDARQTRFEGVVHVDADPGAQRVLLMDETRTLHLVEWPTGASLSLPRLAIPDEFNLATRGWKSHVLGSSIFDIRLGANRVSALTSEGFWTCDLEAGAEWVRVTGHPNDPPAGMTLTNKKSFGFKGPIALGHDGASLRLGASQPVALSADGTTVVGAPSVRDILGRATDYTLELKTFSLAAPEPITLPVKLRSAVTALALNADGSVVAFSEGRDFRVVRQGQKRASQFSYDKMYVRSVGLSADGQFAAATGLHPSDLRAGPTKTVVWDVASREVIDEVPRSRFLAFVGHGEHMRLAVAGLGSQSRVEMYVPGRFEPECSFAAVFPQTIRGDSRFLVVRNDGNEAEVCQWP